MMIFVDEKRQSQTVNYLKNQHSKIQIQSRAMIFMSRILLIDICTYRQH